MDLFLSQKPNPDGTRRTLRLVNLAAPDIEIFFDLIGEAPPPPRVLDGFVAGVIFHAMRVGQPLRVDGPMTKEALCNLNEFQDAWVRWRPRLYRKIEIIPSAIVTPEIARERRAIAAFSGGVDSIFTILRHNRGRLGNASYLLRDSVLMVHGFDVSLENPASLEALKDRTAPLLQECGLKLKLIRTNLKTQLLQAVLAQDQVVAWEDSHMAQLACCLHNYSHDFYYALVGSSEPYDGLVLPWGSTPATDHLLSGGTMRLVHDGAGFSRTEKVAYIANDGTASRVLKVCWQGKEAHKNCGVCDKCVRTQANFLAVGVARPACFDAPLDPRLIRTIPLRGAVQLAEMESIIAYAKAKGMKGEWLEELQAQVKIFKSSWRHQTRTAGRYIRTFLAMLAHGEISEIVAKVRKNLIIRRIP
jgi:hypothetical protein